MPLKLPTCLRNWLQRIALLGLLLMAWLGLAATSLAGELPPNEPNPAAIEPPPRSSLGASDISSEKVNQFVQAYLKVLALIERREGELQGAETESESLRVQQEIEAEAFAIIETEGLTSQEYLQLLGLANIDPEFGERIAAQLQEAID
jgi:Domain of unknown function (DUF4168)